MLKRNVFGNQTFHTVQAGKNLILSSAGMLLTFHFSGFVHFFRPKMLGLFISRTFPYFENSRTFFSLRIYQKPRKMFAFKPMF